MLVPILPIFLTQSLGASGAVLGLVDGVAQAVRNLVDGFSGAVSDYLRQRKALVLGGYALSALSKPLMGFSTIWQVFLAARLLDRLGAGVRSAPRDALIASSLNTKERARGFGLEAVGENAGACIGPLLTLFLLFTWQIEIRTVFYIAVVPALLGLFVIAFIRERPPAGGSGRSTFTLSGLSKPYWKLLVVTALFSAGNSSNSFLILRSQEMGTSIVLLSTLYAGFNLVAAVAAYPAGWLADKVGRKLTILSSYIIFFVVYMGFLVLQTAAGLALMFILYGLYQGIFRSVGKALASDYATEQVRASAIGFFSATVGLMQLVASLAAGLLWDRISHESVFIFGCGTSFIGAVALVLVIPSQGPTSGQSVQTGEMPQGPRDGLLTFKNG
jgi:MFS family permease